MPNASVRVEIAAEPEPTPDRADAVDLDNPAPPVARTYSIDIVESAPHGKKDDEHTEHYDGVSLADIATKLATSTRVKVETKLDLTTPAHRAADLPTGNFPIKAKTGTVVKVPPAKFAGSESARTGINGLAIADNVTMVMVPDLATVARRDDGTIDHRLWKSVQLALINHCEGQPNRMAVLDTPPDLEPAAGQGVARRRQLQHELRSVVLPVDRSREPGRHQRRHRGDGPAVWSHGGGVGAHR